MSGLTALPDEVVATIERSSVTEFATVTRAGVPIDTPLFSFPSDDLATLDVATGLSYPAKAERARRNPKVGMFLPTGPDQPVVLVRGRAAVRDGDLQANAERYVAETGFDAVGFGLPWAEARKAVWYWTRVIIEVTPERVHWWEGPRDGRSAPHLEQRGPGPLPGIRPAAGRARSVPWTGAGPATVTFFGMETFVGTVVTEGDVCSATIDRALPLHPLLQNPRKVLKPSAEIRATLLRRLVHEVVRRGQRVPVLPEEQPALTRLATVRAGRPFERVPRISGNR